ncbi:hypothetical protein KSS87_011670 [Heliosperma pusillum]|nr:hypothetical protein KSS87_011670 [Heliosperma pusillum]
MKTYGEDISDTRIVQKILVTLTKRFDMIVTVIEESRDILKLTVTELLGSLHAHEQKFKNLESSSRMRFHQCIKLNVPTQKGGRRRAMMVVVTINKCLNQRESFLLAAFVKRTTMPKRIVILKISTYLCVVSCKAGPTLIAWLCTNKNGYKALIAAEYSGVNVELAKNFEMGVSNKTPEFLNLNPIGKIPVLETPDGPIFESNAIARYVARLKPENPLFGASLIEYAHVEQWLDFASMEIDPNISRWYYPRAGYVTHYPLVEELAISSLTRALDALNKHLASNTYLVGHNVTLADIVMTCNLSSGFRLIMTKSFTSEFPHVERYFWTMVNQPNFKKVLGEVPQTESVPPVVKKPSQSAKPKAKEEQKKDVKKEETKPKEPEPALEEEAPKPKAKNPLDLLPPSKMILDDWKRLYSNTKTNFREVAIKGGSVDFVGEVAFPWDWGVRLSGEVSGMWGAVARMKRGLSCVVLGVGRGYLRLGRGFWDMYDPEGYSLWFCDYKYNDENTVSFVTLNKVGGFLQRMDLVRKYAFGKMLIIGSGPYKVKGLWLFRGSEIPQFVMDECYDMELYDWTKVDINDEAQKERVNQMIEDCEPFEGEALLDAKCFK